MIKKVLFICRGNMERSQMAQGYYNYLSKTQNATSAGVIDISEYYPSPPELTIQIMREEGIDISQQKVKQVKKDMLSGVELICVFCEWDTVPNFVKRCGIEIIQRPVEDPYLTDRASAIKIRNAIKHIVTSILDSN